MVQLVLGMSARPTPDDAADALAIAVCIANGIGQVGRSSRPAGAARASIAGPRRPSTAARSPYERAVREALAREKREKREARTG